MNRKYLIYLMVGIIAISIYVYLYVFYIPGQLRIKEDLLSMDTSLNSSTNDTGTEFIPKKTKQPETNFNIGFAYRNTARNPFSDYREKENLNPNQNPKGGETSDSIKTNLPFKLVGIIGNANKKIAILETKTESGLVRQGETFKGYQIKKISEDEILMQYNNIEVHLAVGGDSHY